MLRNPILASPNRNKKKEFHGDQTRSMVDRFPIAALNDCLNSNARLEIETRKIHGRKGG
jgi:hypothetical protein